MKTARPHAPRRLARLSMAVTLLASGCASAAPEPEPNWVEAEVSIASDRVLWKMMLLAAETRGFPLTGSTDPSSREVLTGWRTNLQPFSRKGTRLRAGMSMEPRGPKRWAVRAHVQKQINNALVSPLDPTRAEWVWAPDDTLEAQLLLRHVVSSMPEQELELRNEAREARLERGARGLRP